MAQPGAIAIPHLSPRVQHVVLWRDVRQSALLFGGTTLAYLVVAWAPISWSVLLAQAVAILAATSLLWSMGAKALGRSGPPVPSVLLDGITDEQLKPLLDKCRPTVNMALVAVGRVASGNDMALSAKVFAAAWVTSWLASRISLISAAYIVVFLAFTLPKVYELKRAEIDHGLGLAKAKGHELYAKFDEVVLKKVPMGHKKSQ